MKRALCFALAACLVLTGACAGQPLPAPAAPDAVYAAGTAAGDVYENRYFALRFTLPEGWSFQDVAALAALLGSETAEPGLPEVSTYYEFYAGDGGDGTAMLTVEDLSRHQGGRLVTVRAFADALAAQYAAVESVPYVIGELQTAELAGRTAMVLPVSAPDSGYFQRSWVFRTNDYMATLTFCSADESALDELERAVTKLD